MTPGQLLRFRPSPRLWLIIATAVMALILLVVLRDRERLLNEIYSPGEIAYFKEVTFGEDAEISRFAAPGSEKSSQVNVITKWTIDVQIYIVGYWSSADLVEAETIVPELDDPISISMVQDVQAANFFVFLVSRQDFDWYLSVRNTSTLGGAGQLYGLDEAEWAVIVMGSDFPDDIHRDTLREEIAQMFGLPHDSRRYPDSVFY